MPCCLASQLTARLLWSCVSPVGLWPYWNPYQIFASLQSFNSIPSAEMLCASQWYISHCVQLVFFFPLVSLSLSSNNPFSPGKGQGAFSCDGLVPLRNAKQVHTERVRVSFLDSEIFQQFLKVCVEFLERFYISIRLIQTNKHIFIRISNFICHYTE